MPTSCSGAELGEDGADPARRTLNRHHMPFPVDPRSQHFEIEIGGVLPD